MFLLINSIFIYVRIPLFIFFLFFLLLIHLFKHLIQPYLIFLIHFLVDLLVNFIWDMFCSILNLKEHSNSHQQYIKNTNSHQNVSIDQKIFLWNFNVKVNQSNYHKIYLITHMIYQHSYSMNWKRILVRSIS